jgi:hypothetical protein
MRMMPVIGVMLLACLAQAHAQADYQPPRNREGRPDFTGVWSARWATPLERPDGAANLVVRPEQAAELAADLLGLRIRNNPLSPQAANPDSVGLLVVRGELRSSQIIDPTDGKLPLTSEGVLRRREAASQNADGPEARVPSERCLAGYWRAPILLGPEGMYMQIVQTPDALVLYGEAIGNVRIVEFGSSRRPAAVVSWQGEGTARWDGDTLVVETTRFRHDDLARGAPYGNFPISPTTRITERFARLSNSEIVYRYTVDDSLLFTRPWTAELSLTRSNSSIFETACHEGNYSMTNILRAARVSEGDER